MKTLIAYSSKRGFTKKCVEILSSKLAGEIKIIDLKNNSDFNISEFDNLLVGGSIYAGKIRKEVTEFCNKNLDEISNKNIGLFICGMAEDKDVEKEIKTNFPETLYEKALVKDIFGGEFNFSKMNFFEKAIIKKIARSSENQEKLYEDKINKFAETFNNL
jgi:menaquinone-dependent protoporphyrinogen oxidase